MEATNQLSGANVSPPAKTLNCDLMKPPYKFDQHIGIYISSSHVRTFLLSLLSCLIFGCDKQPAGPSISGIAVSTTCADPGHVVTIAGDVLRSETLKVSVGTLVSRVIATNGISASFEVPLEAPIGSTNIVLQRQTDGQELSRIPFKVGECSGTERPGFRLPGQDSTRAIESTFTVLADSVRADEMKNGIFLSRLDAYIDSDASVGQINAVLDKINGQIVAMLPGSGAITIAIPPASNIDELRQIERSLNNSPGIKFAIIAHAVGDNVLPPGAAGDFDTNPNIIPLLPTRFPAIWNAGRPCPSKKIDIVVTDNFPLPAPATFFNEIPKDNFALFGAPPTEGEPHGYDVVAMIAAQFNATDPTGANPFPHCIKIHAIQVYGRSPQSRTTDVLASVPAGKFLWNFSQGYPSCKKTACDHTLAAEIITAPIRRAYEAVEWKGATVDRWDDFLMITAAGNSGDPDGSDVFDPRPDAAIYPGLSEATCASEMNLATLLNPPLFQTISDPLLWDPQGGHQNYPKLTATGPDLRELAKDASELGPATNVIITGSTLSGMRPTELIEAPFSNRGADIYAVGVGVFSFGDGNENGTSISAPQVTGLAAYLWMMSDDLRNHQPSSITKRAILANARTVPKGSGASSVMNVLDAYASLLSLDPASLPNPSTTKIRLAILDVNADGVFDEKDVRQYLDHYLLAELEVEPKDPDFSRFDLNGDGFTGGSKMEKFDLDRVGSTQYGETSYTTVAQVIEDEPVEYDEMNLTDKDILCYYAYSDLYQGNPDTRDELLAGVCIPGEAATPTTTPTATATTTPTATPSATPRPCALINRSTCSHINRYGAGPGDNSVGYGVFSACRGNVELRSVEIDPVLTIFRAGGPGASGQITYSNVVPQQNPGVIGSHTAKLTFVHPAHPEETLTLTFTFTMVADPVNPNTHGGTTSISGDCTHIPQP